MGSETAQVAAGAVGPFSDGDSQDALPAEDYDASSWSSSLQLVAGQLAADGFDVDGDIRLATVRSRTCHSSNSATRRSVPRAALWKREA